MAHRRQHMHTHALKGRGVVSGSPEWQFQLYSDRLVLMLNPSLNIFNIGPSYEHACTHGCIHVVLCRYLLSKKSEEQIQLCMTTQMHKSAHSLICTCRHLKDVCMDTWTHVSDSIWNPWMSHLYIFTFHIQANETVQTCTHRMWHDTVSQTH